VGRAYTERGWLRNSVARSMRRVKGRVTTVVNPHFPRPSVSLSLRPPPDRAPSEPPGFSTGFATSPIRVATSITRKPTISGASVSPRDGGPGSRCPSTGAPVTRRIKRDQFMGVFLRMATTSASSPEDRNPRLEVICPPKPGGLQSASDAGCVQILRVILRTSEGP
jgi:hypothetical protein